MTTRDSSIKIAGETEEGVNLTINGQKIYTDRNNNFQAETTLKKGLNIILIRAVNRFNKNSEITRRVILE